MMPDNNKVYEIIDGFDRVPSGTKIKVMDTGSEPNHVHGHLIGRTGSAWVRKDNLRENDEFPFDVDCCSYGP